MAVLLNIRVFRDVTPWRLENNCQRLDGRSGFKLKVIQSGKGRSLRTIGAEVEYTKNIRNVQQQFISRYGLAE